MTHVNNLPPKMTEQEWAERDRQFANGFHWCSRCEYFYPLSQFSKAKSCHYGFYNWCKRCHSESRKGDPKTQKSSRERARSFMAHYKRLMGGKCARCGYDESQYALDFHHVNSEDKEASVSPLISRGAPHEEIWYEINKCILLCATCHRSLEGSVWTCDFEKSEGVGFIIKPGTIAVNPGKGWVNPKCSDVTLATQKALF